MPFTHVRHVLTARPDAVPEARRLIRSYVEEQCPNAGAIRDAVALSVSEAVGNVVRHAYPEPSGDIEITAQVEDGWLHVVVRDWGMGWRPSPDPGLGLGVPLMRTMADFSVTAVPDGGSRVVLRFPCAGSETPARDFRRMVLRDV